MKCQTCHDPIPKGKEKYVRGKRVCGWCFGRQRKRNKTSNRAYYIKWIIERKEKNEKKHKKREEEN